MQILDSIDDLFEHLLSLIFSQLPSLLVVNEVAETSPRPEVQDQTVEVLEGADLVERDDVGMVQPGHDLGLPVEILHDVGIFDFVHPDDLDCHILLDNQMFGQFNFAEGAFTETGAQELVVANLRQLSTLLRFLKGKYTVLK